MVPVPLPFATSTFSILRSDADPSADGYADVSATWTASSEGIRGHLSQPTFAEVRAGSVQTLDLLSLALDPCDLAATDRIQDERDLQVYEIEGSPMTRVGLGLDHQQIRVRLVRGWVG